MPYTIWDFYKAFDGFETELDFDKLQYLLRGIHNNISIRSFLRATPGKARILITSNGEAHGSPLRPDALLLARDGAMYDVLGHRMCLCEGCGQVHNLFDLHSGATANELIPECRNSLTRLGINDSRTIMVTITRSLSRISAEELAPELVNLPAPAIEKQPKRAPRAKRPKATGATT